LTRGKCTGAGPCPHRRQDTSVGYATASAPTEGDLEQEQFTPSLQTGAGTYRRGLCRRPDSPPHPAPKGRGRRPTGPAAPCRPATQHQTTSVLTAAMLVYALGAGITAAAGTRLALQLILITVFGLHPFQVPLVTRTRGIAAVRRCLTGNVSALGNLRACCPP